MASEGLGPTARRFEKRPPAYAMASFASSGSAQFEDHLDLTDDGFVEGVEVFRRYPILEVRPAASSLHFIPRDKVLSHLEPGYKACSAGRDVPVASDLDRVFLGENWVENRLLGRRGGKARIAAFSISSSS